MNSQEAYEKLRSGVAKFQTEVYPPQRARFEALAKGQSPLALFIACADSRIVPTLITQTGPGELFVARNPGNFVPRYDEDFIGGISSSVEYAMLALKVPVIIVCGHTDCGVMKALLHPEHAAHMPAVANWMRYGAEPQEQLQREAAEASDEDKLRLLTQWNVQAQIEHLKTHPSVQSRLIAGEVEIFGWIYDIGAGSGWTLDAATGQFRRIERAAAER